MPNSKSPILSSLTEEIANVIKDRILNGEYAIGEKIKENEIAEELKVSRTPIREAIKQLEAEGLINCIPNRGSFALGFTKQDIEDIYTVRALIEGLAVSWAVAKITDHEIEKLQDIYELMEFYSNKKNSEKVVEMNREFHKIIYNASNSRFLVQILKSYQEYVQQTRKVTVYVEENLDSILKEHYEILKAIKERDENKATEKILSHLSNSQSRAEIGIKRNKDLLLKITKQTD